LEFPKYAGSRTLSGKSAVATWQPISDELLRNLEEDLVAACRAISLEVTKSACGIPQQWQDKCALLHGEGFIRFNQF